MAVENKKMQQRRDTAANWTAADPILAAGEIGFETDTDQFKIGDGVTAWTADPDYYVPGAGSSIPFTPASSSGAASLDFNEDTDNGIHKIILTAPSAIAANVTLTLPEETGILATQTFVNGLITGLSWKNAVRVATTVAGTLATSFENGDTVDGVVLATGDRILIKNQATATENGIYVVAASGAPTRSTDADTGAELVNASVYVQEGTANADKQFVCTTNAPISIGSTNITFTEFSSGSGIAIGSAVSGGGANRILYEDGSQNLASDADFTFASDILTLPTAAGGALSITSAGDSNTGFSLWGSDAISFITGGGSQVGVTVNQFNAGNSFQYGWNPNGSSFQAGLDTGLARFAAGVVRFTDGVTGIRGFQGGGASVASASALPLPTGRVFHVTGTTSITSITATNLQAGVVITLIFDDILTFTDGSNLMLAGNFVTSAKATITLAYDGTDFYELSRSVN